MEKIALRKWEGQKGNLRDFLTILFKYKTRIVLIFSFIVITVTMATLLLPPVFEAKSSLLVKYGREYLNSPEVGATTAPVMALHQEEVLNSEIQILTSPDLIRKVIETLKVANVYPDLVEDPPENVKPIDVAMARFQEALAVEGVRKSSVIQVSFQHDNPEIAARAVNLLVELYKEKHLQVFSSPQSSFLEKQVTAYRQKLLDTEKSMQAFKQKNRVYSLEEQRSLLLKQRTDLHTALMDARNSVSELQKRLATLKVKARHLTSDSTLYVPTERDRIIVDAKSRLLALELTEHELLRKYTESNRLVVDTRKQIQHVRNFLKEQEADIKSTVQTGNVVYQEAQKGLVTTEADLSAQRAKASALAGELSQLDGEIRALDLREKEMLTLKRELVANEKNFQIYGDKMEEARITDDMNRLKLANISVIQPAAVPVEPSKPDKKLNVALGIIIGALSSIGFALFSERNSQGLLTPVSAAKRLNMVVLAAIPYKEGNHVRELL